MKRIRTLVRRLLPSGHFARSVSILAGGTALSQGIAVLITPLLTRLYPVADFGHFQIYLSCMSFASLAVTLRYEQAIYLPEREEVAANLLVVTLCSIGVMTVFLGGVTWLLQQSRHLPTSAEGLRPYLLLVPFGICGAGVYQTLSIWALRQKAYSQVSGTKLAQAISQHGTQVVIGFLHAGPLGLLLGDVIGRATGSVGLARLSFRRSWDVCRLVRWRTMWSAAVRYRRFPLISSWSALINIAGYSLPPLLIAQLYGAKTLGWFALGDRVLGVPVTLIGQAVSQVYSIEAASVSTRDPQAMRALFLRSMKRLALLGIAPFLVLVAFSPFLFGFLFGTSWREAGVYARLLAPMYYLAFISSPLTSTLNILEQQVLQLAWDLGRIGLTLGSLWIVFRTGGSAREAIGGLAAAMWLGYGAHLLLSHRAITKRIEQFPKTSAVASVTAAQDYAELRNS
jgi:O-antigen/teichoic acid export membrane protein